MTKLYSRQAENAVKKISHREITHRHYEVQLRFFHTALCIITTNTNAKFPINQTGDDKVIIRTKNYSNELYNSRANNSTCSIPITPFIKPIRDLRVIYILTNFGANWLIFVDAKV